MDNQSDKDILRCCLGLMQDLTDEFEEWYKWMHGEDAIENIDPEERFALRMSYFHIIQRLFLFNTNHSGGTSTREKCRELGLDSGEEVTFGFDDEEEDE